MVWADMGTGKTSSTLIALSHINKYIEDIFPVLVLAPKRVATTTWPEEVKKWDAFKDIKVSNISGTPTQRKKALAARADIFTTNYEQLPWLVELFGKKWPFKTVVADEVTRLKSFRIRGGGSRAKALGKVAHKFVDRFIGLTGTPAPNGIKDLHGQIWFVDKGERLGASYTQFKERFFTVGYDGFTMVPREGAQDEIEKLLADVCLTIRAQDYFDIDEPIVNTIRVQLPPKARQLYEDMEKRMFVEIAEEEIEAFNAMTKTGKCLQLANGAVYHEDNTWTETYDGKIDALRSVVEESNGMPVLVAYQFRSDLERLVAAFPNGRQLDNDPQTQIDWNAGKIPILFAHPKSAGHGLNLQDGSNILCFFSHGWSLEDHQQIIERIGPTRQRQSGYDRPVYVHHIVAADTVEETVIERLAGKASVQELLKAAMVKRSEGKSLEVTKNISSV